MSNSNHKYRRLTFVGLSLLAVAAIATSLSGIVQTAPVIAAVHAAAPAPLTHEQQEFLDSANTLSEAFRVAADRVLPSVVTIQTTGIEVSSSQDDSNGHGSPNGLPDELFNDPFFKRFFKGLPEFPRGVPFNPQRQGLGSGVIIDPSGIILTNNHVVAHGGRVTVRLHDGREFEAAEVKTDPKTDIAVVRIDGAGDLPAAAIGDSDTLEIGDWVIAVGAPFGLKETVTAGIISAKSRGVGIAEREDFLQTDAAINPGNSGGPLVNLKGEVVGINTAISTTSGGYQGVGFAVPVNLAKWVSNELVARGSVQRAFLGVLIQPLTDALSKQLGMKTVKGALVTEVRNDSPAAKAGLETGDVIVTFDGRPVGSPRDLQAVVERAAIGQTHKLEVIREGKRLTLNVSVDELPENLTAGDSVGNNGPKAEFDELGMDVANLNSDIAEQLGLENIHGVVITSVKSGSPAERAGLTPSMVITRVGKQPIKNVENFRSALKDLKLSDGILLLVRNNEGSHFVVLKN